MPNILIHSPYKKDKGQGNSVTATRLGSILSELGIQVSHSEQGYEGEAADAMIALNARKSAKAVARFRYLHPDPKLVVVLTGTDINHPDVIDKKSATWISMKLADSLVVLHEASLQQVPQVFRTKTRVIYPSVVLTDGLAHRPEGEGFSVIMSGNMRPEKNPQLVAAAQELIPDNVHIHIYGDFSGASTPRMQNHGVVSHDKMLAAMSRAHVLLNTSFQEGGANAICEAVSMGLPVIASAIPGNIGMLGEDYAGLFKSNDLTELCEILEKAAKNPDFYAQLKGQVAARAPLFTYEQEASAWREQFQDLSN